MKKGFYINNIRNSTQIEKLTENGNVEVTIHIAGDFELSGSASEEKIFLNAWITNREGDEVDRIFPLPIEKEMQFCMCVENPDLWNAEQVYVYDLNLELCDENGKAIDCGTRKIAFWKWEILDGKTCLNKKPIDFRAEVLPAGLTDSERLKKFLEELKRNYQNALLIRSEEKSDELELYCILYGIYLLVEGEHVESARLMARKKQPEMETNPDFALQVVQNGVLIENRCVFANVSEYDLCYEVVGENEEKRCGVMTADVPPKTSRFVEVPFELPDRPGEYLYRVSLCLKENTIWEEAGYCIARAQTQISNFFGREF